jgi:iron complex outermembrane receptor protein
MKKNYFYEHKRTLLALAITASFSANAQESNEQLLSAKDEAVKKEKIEKIVVVGEFQQSLINRIPVKPKELPFTLNVVDRDLLNDRNFSRPIEALTTLPNIFRTEDRQGTGGTGFLSRGFDAPILVDNRVQNNFRGTGARDSSFVERYEVLKGPASIASGPVGAGGIINTVTKSPELERSAGVKLRADQFSSAGVDFDVNVGEIDGSDTVLLRVSGAYRDFKFDADEVSRKTTALRPVAIFNLGDATSAKASIAYTKHEVTPQSGFPLMENGDIPDGIDTSTFTGYQNSEGEVEDTLVNLEVHHQFLDNLKLTVRGSKQQTDFDYQNTSGLYNYRGDAGLKNMLVAYPKTSVADSEATFVDAQLAYTTNFWGQNQNIVIGVAHDERSFDRRFNAYSLDGPYSLMDIDEPRYGNGGSGDPAPFTLNESELESIFAEAALRPTEKLTIVAGIRYDQLVQNTTNWRRGNQYVAEYDDNELTVRLGASLATSENINVYASYAQAFVPQFGLRKDNKPVPAETSDGFELGAKGSVFDNLITFQAGVFHTLRNDVSLQDPNNTPNSPAFVVSAGEVRVQGLEFSSNISPVDGLDVTFNVGYTDVEVTEAGNDEILEPVFPDLTGSLYINYEIQSGVLEGLSLGGGLRHMSEREGPKVTWDSQSIADLNFGYQIAENINVSFDILNVTDEFYVENTFQNTVNKLTGSAVLGAPRTAVITLNWAI